MLLGERASGMSAADTANLSATHAQSWAWQWRPLLSALLVFAAYYVGAKVGLALTFSPSPISVLWPPNAVLLAALLLAPVRGWSVVVLAALPAHLLAELQGHVPTPMVLCWFLSNASEALIGATCVRALTRQRPTLDNVREVAVFIAGAVFLAPFASSFLDAAFVILNGWGNEPYWQLWKTRFFSNVLATITLVPVIVTAATVDFARVRALSLVRMAESIALAFGLVLAGVLVFDFDPAVAPSIPLYVTVPFLVWAALRFGPLGASASFAAIAFLTIWGAAHGRGPFTGGDPNENALTVQLFLTLVGMATLTLAAFLKERDRAQAALRESEAHFRNIANTAPVMIWVADADRRFTFFNKGWLDFTGRSLEEEVVAKALNGVHPDDLHRCQHAYAAAFAGRRAFDLEYRYLRQDGVYRWIIDSGVPRFEGTGRFLGYIGSRMDITERHDLQRSRQELAHIARLSAMGELAASLAHELNQPLTAILTNVHAALRMTAAERVDMQEIRAILRDVANDDHRATEVMRRMRTLARKGELEVAVVDLGGIIREVAVLVQSDAVLRGVHLAMEIDEHLSLIGDKVQLQQVLLNLLLNAFDAVRDRPRGERLVAMRAQRVAGGMIQVGVADNGTGLSADRLDKIFMPFFTSKRDGLGLGLSISRSIVEAHGGQLRGTNNHDRGATFYFVLPERDSTETAQV